MKQSTAGYPVTLYVPAKLNLTCDVLYKKPDGYHELDLLNLRVALFDQLEFTPAENTEIVYDGMPAPENDLVARAIRAYSVHAGCDAHARVHVHKRIPAQAGLGGGSADAAAVLQALETAYGALDPADLHAAALSLGADVPYCLHAEPCRARGIGELLEPLTIRGTLWFLLLKPEAGISTAALFSSLSLPVPHPDTNAAAAALIRGDAAALGPLLYNALQPAAQAQLPEIGELSARLKTAGALGASMTGSGSCVFGLFACEAAARSAQAVFRDVPFSTVCRSLPY